MHAWWILRPCKIKNTKGHIWDDCFHRKCSCVLWLGGTGVWGRLYTMGGRGHRSPKYEKKRHQKLLRCGAGEMAQSGKHLLCKHEDLSSILSTFKSWAWQPYLISELLTQMRDLLASFWGTHRRLTAGLHLHMCTWTRIYAHIYTLEKGLRCIKTMWHVYLC